MVSFVTVPLALVWPSRCDVRNPGNSFGVASWHWLGTDVPQFHSALTLQALRRCWTPHVTFPALTGSGSCTVRALALTVVAKGVCLTLVQLYPTIGTVAVWVQVKPKMPVTASCGSAWCRPMAVGEGVVHVGAGCSVAPGWLVVLGGPCAERVWSRR